MSKHIISNLSDVIESLENICDLPFTESEEAIKQMIKINIKQLKLIKGD